MKQKMTFFTFISAYRIVYAIPFVFASLTGIIRGYFYTLDLSLAFFILWEVFWLAMFVNLSNDYFDFRTGSDLERFRVREKDKDYIYEKVLNAKVYWQGNLFDLGYMTKKQGQVMLGCILLIILVSAYPLLVFRGWIILMVGVIGLFISYFYTAPPLNLGAKGFGEISVFISFAMIAYFSFFVMTGEHSGEVFIFSITVGITGFLMRLADSMTGYEAHKNLGEKDLSVRLGIPGSIQLIHALLFCLYTLLIFSAILFHQWKFILPLLTIPGAIKIFKIYGKKEDNFRIIRAVPEMLKLSTGNSLLIVITWLSVFLLH